MQPTIDLPAAPPAGGTREILKRNSIQPMLSVLLRGSMFSAACLVLATTTFAHWPQAAGPDGNWQGRGPAAPVQWSVARDQNIIWRTPLPNGGQSGIAVWGDRVFLTTFDVFKDGDPKFPSTILGHCLDAKTGRLLWSVRLHGPTKSPMLYAYSDSTSPTPVTDGKHVWFTNNSGEMGCWDFAGHEVWRRSYTPWGEPYPFNKQHEPMLVGDTIINVEPADGNLPTKSGWNYLRGIDKLTGKTRWIADDGTTSYCTSVFGHTATGEPAVLTGRGGHHAVPERPVGLSLVSLAPGREGKTIWRYVADTDADGRLLKEPGSLDAPTWQALYTLHWDTNRAYWFRLNPEETHLVIDSRTGAMLREQSLIRGVDYRQWDPATKQHIVHTNVNLRDLRELAPRNLLAPDEVIRVQPAWHCNIVLNGYHYFLTSTAHRRNRHAPKGRAGPSHCIARVNIASGKAEYFEVPVTVLCKPGSPDEPVYGVAVRTTTLNSAGQDVAAEDRSRTDGWEIPAFWGSPVAINDKIYVTTMIGITYVIDSKAPVLDAKALLAVNDLGASGETWSLNSISYDGGRIYHRSLKEVVCIGQKSPATPSGLPDAKRTEANATTRDGFVSLFNGKHLEGWTTRQTNNGEWSVVDGVIDCNPRGDAKGDRELWSRKEYGDFELMVDWRIKESPYVNRKAGIILPDGSYKRDEAGNIITITAPNTDSGVFLRGQHKSQVNIWCWPVGSGEVWGYRTDPVFSAAVHAGATPKVKADRPIGEWNTFHIVMKGDRLTVTLNDKLVIDHAQLPGVPAKGPLALQLHPERRDGEWGASLVQFRNIRIKELTSTK